MTAGVQIELPAEPPPPLRLSSPQVVELREGGGCLALFGLPFFIAGVVMALASAGIQPVRVTWEGESRPLALAATGAAFLAIGGVLMFGRRWLTLDVSRGLLVRSYGLLVPIHSRERPLTEFSAVVIAFVMGDSDSGEQYPVRLRSVMGQDFVISTPAKFADSRSQAEYLSGFLRLPLVDMTTDHETVVAPERAGQALRERLLVDAAKAQQPPRPQKMRCEVNESPGKAIVIIPGGGSWAAGVLGVVFPLVILFVVIPRFLHAFTRAAPPLVQFGFLVFMVAIFVLPSIAASVHLMVSSKRRRSTVTASQDGLVIEQQKLGRSHTTEVPAGELLDLDCATVEAAMKAVRNSRPRVAGAPNPEAPRLVAGLGRWVPSQGIVVKSRTGLITFGEGLRAGELQYLTWVLRKALAGR